MSDVDFLEALKRLSPGTALRDGVERVIQYQNGALIVLGWGPDVEALCTGGFVLDEADFTGARMAELAKMDGAIVLDDDCSKIVRANVHLVTGRGPTDETGARHRTAQRVAAATNRPVVSVSEDRQLAVLFMGEHKATLEDPTELAAKVNINLQSLERFRRRFDEAIERLNRFEVTDLVVYKAVVDVLQRAEFVLRIAEDIEMNAIGLGREGALAALQHQDLVSGVDEQRGLVLADYVRGRGKAVERALTALSAVPVEDLNDSDAVAAAVGFDHLESPASPLGHRLLSRVPRLPSQVRSAIVRHFGNFQKMLIASVDELDQVTGVGTSRAVQLRQFFDRILDEARHWDSAYGV